MSATAAWLADRDDERVIAALDRMCRLCYAYRGEDCRSIVDPRQPLATGIVHMARVPKRVLFDHRNGA